MSFRRGVPFGTQAERRRADLFWADLMGLERARRNVPRSSLLVAPGQAANAEWAEEVDFYSWPTMTGALPNEIVNQIVANRARVTVDPAELKPNKGKGYFAVGRTFKPTVLGSPEEERDLRRKEILTRLHKELGGEGGTSSVMTGDKAKFTWGHGMAHGGGLEPWANKFLSSQPEARRAMLDLGIALEDRTWKIVDTARQQVAEGEAAMDLLNGPEPAAEKKLLLTCFKQVAEQYGVDAANVQWSFVKERYFSQVPKEVIADTNAWSAKAICYVIHCCMWGNFAGWEQFKATRGDSKKILRLEVDYTGYYDDQGAYLLVPPERAKAQVHPSITMLRNMGGNYMIDDRVVEPLDALADARQGDIVFQMDRLSKAPFYVLRGVSPVWMGEILNVHYYSMSQLLDYFEKKVRDSPKENKGYARLKKMRDCYASNANPEKEIVGLRPRIAMDAVLHRGEGASASWILGDCVNAALPPDQVELIKQKLGIK